MRLSKCFLISFTYIGGVIGAGFATGREVMLYFGDHGLLSAVAGGVIMGLLAGVFLFSARYFNEFRQCGAKWTKAVYVAIKICLYLSIYATFLCMISACEEIIDNDFHIKNVGLWTGIFVSFLGIMEMGVMQKLNLVIVPIILVLLLVLASKADTPASGSLVTAAVLNYAGMNIMTGGYLIAEQKEKFTLKECVFVAIVTAIAFAAALALVYGVSIEYKNFSMPIFEYSKKYDFESVSGMVIYLAIFTTLIGCSKLICEENENVKIPKICSVLLLIVTTFIGLKLDFGRAVNKIYPVVGYVGVIYLIFMLVLPVFWTIYVKKSKNPCRGNADGDACRCTLQAEKVQGLLKEKTSGYSLIPCPKIRKDPSIQGRSPSKKSAVPK